MNTKLKSIFKTITLSLGALLLVTTATYAIGTLTPSGTPGSDTQYTLNDIYAKLTDFTATADEGTGLFTTPGTVEATFRTLSEIYALLEAEEDDLVPENIRDGVTVFGVEGTVVEEVVLEWSVHNDTSLFFDQASAFCDELDNDGTGWRLPTSNELIQAMGGRYGSIGLAASPKKFRTSNDGRLVNYYSPLLPDQNFVISVDNLLNGFVYEDELGNVACVR